MMRVAALFFTTAVLSVLGGMVWGIVMAATGDHSLSGAHAHLNLVGWATMALTGVYYAMTGRASSGWLPMAHFGLAFTGLVTLVPGIAMAVSGKGEGLAILGSFLTLGAMLIFLFTVLKHGFGPERAG
jgi:hypothetical protein